MLTPGIINTNCFLELLPEELIVLCAEFLQIDSLLHLSLVNKLTHRIAHEKIAKHMLNLLNNIYPIYPLVSQSSIYSKLNQIVLSQREEILYFKNLPKIYPELTKLLMMDIKKLHLGVQKNGVHINAEILKRKVANKKRDHAAIADGSENEQKKLKKKFSN